MNKKFVSLILMLMLSLPSYAIDCYKKPCHKKCIDNQSQAIKTQCWCNSRKLVYYHIGRNIGMPEYE